VTLLKPPGSNAVVVYTFRPEAPSRSVVVGSGPWDRAHKDVIARRTAPDASAVEALSKKESRFAQCEKATGNPSHSLHQGNNVIPTNNIPQLHRNYHIFH